MCRDIDNFSVSGRLCPLRNCDSPCTSEKEVILNVLKCLLLLCRANHNSYVQLYKVPLSKWAALTKAYFKTPCTFVKKAHTHCLKCNSLSCSTHCLYLVLRSFSPLHVLPLLSVTQVEAVYIGENHQPT